MLKTILEILNNLLIFTGSIGAIYSGWSWFVERRHKRILDQTVTIMLVAEKDGRELFILPFRPTRRTLSRAELLGLLGMIPSRQRRFDWMALIEPRFFQAIEDAIQGTRDSIEIPLSDLEFSQLDIQQERDPIGVPSGT